MDDKILVFLSGREVCKPIHNIHVIRPLLQQFLKLLVSGFQISRNSLGFGQADCGHPSIGRSLLVPLQP